MHSHYIVQVYLEGIDHCLDLEYDSKEEAQEVVDRIVDGICASDGTHGLLKITDGFIIKVDIFKAVKVSEMTWYDSDDIIPPFICPSQTTLDDYCTDSTVTVVTKDA